MVMSWTVEAMGGIKRHKGTHIFIHCHSDVMIYVCIYIYIFIFYDNAKLFVAFA